MAIKLYFSTSSRRVKLQWFEYFDLYETYIETFCNSARGSGFLLDFYVVLSFSSTSIVRVTLEKSQFSRQPWSFEIAIFVDKAKQPCIFELKWSLHFVSLTIISSLLEVQNNSCFFIMLWLKGFGPWNVYTYIDYMYIYIYICIERERTVYLYSIYICVWTRLRVVVCYLCMLTRYIGCMDRVKAFWVTDILLNPKYRCF